MQKFSHTGNSCFATKPGYVCSKLVSFQFHKRLDRQTHLFAFRSFELILTAFNTRELLDASTVETHLPSIQGKKNTSFDRYIQASDSPIFHVTECANLLLHLDPAIAFEKHRAILKRDKNLANLTIANEIQTDIPVILMLVQPLISQNSQQLEIGQTNVPSVKYHQYWFKTSLTNLLYPLLDVSILAQTILYLVVQADTVWQKKFTIRFNQRIQAGALHNRMVLAIPVSTYRSHLQRIISSQDAFVDQNYTLTRVELSLDFSPKRLIIWQQALQQARVVVISWILLVYWMGLRDFNATKHLFGCYQKVDVFYFIAFEQLHYPYFF